MTITGEIYTEKYGPIIKYNIPDGDSNRQRYAYNASNGKRSVREKLFKADGTIYQVNNYQNGLLHGQSAAYVDHWHLLYELTYIKGIIDADKLRSKSDLKFVGEWMSKDNSDKMAFIFNHKGFAYMNAFDEEKYFGGERIMINGEKARIEYEINDTVNPYHIDIKITKVDSAESISLLLIAGFIDDDTLQIAGESNFSKRPTEFNKENTLILQRTKFNY